METALLALGILAAVAIIFIFAFRSRDHVEIDFRGLFGTRLKAKGRNKLSNETLRPENQIKDSPLLQVETKSSLSHDAQELLLSAASGGGEIIHMQVYGGAVVNVSNKQFIEQNNSRSRAKWEAALDELVKRNFVKTGEMFYRLTAEGYTEADKLSAK